MSDHAQTRLERGRILLFQRRYVQAEAELCLALTGDVDRTLALYWIAWAQQALGRLSEAEATAGRCIAANPERPEGYHVRAVTLRKLNRLADAEAAARIALEKEPGEPEYRAELAWILIRRARAKEALDVLDLGLLAAPLSLSLHRARTECLIQLGQIIKATESAQHALSLNPEDATSRGQLGSIAFQCKDYERAQNHYAEALRLDPQYAYARTGLLSTLRHRLWYYRVLVPKKTETVGRRRNAWFFAFIALVAAIRVSPAVGGTIMLLFVPFLLLAMMFWYLGATAAPITALLLRLNPIGRAALSADEIECSDYAGMLLGAAALSFLAAIIGVWHGLFFVGLLCLLLVAPVAKTFERKGRDRKLGEAYTWLLLSIGCGGIAAFAQKIYALAGVAFLFCGFGALGFDSVTRAIGRIMDHFRPAQRE